MATGAAQWQGNILAEKVLCFFGSTAIVCVGCLVVQMACTTQSNSFVGLKVEGLLFLCFWDSRVPPPPSQVHTHWIHNATIHFSGESKDNSMCPFGRSTKESNTYLFCHPPQITQRFVHLRNVNATGLFLCSYETVIFKKAQITMLRSFARLHDVQAFLILFSTTRGIVR